MDNPEKKPQEQDKKQLLMLTTFSFATEFGFVIALPIIGLGLLGKWLDKHYHVTYFVLIGVLLALTISVIWIGRRIADIRKDMK